MTDIPLYAQNPSIKGTSIRIDHQEYWPSEKNMIRDAAIKWQPFPSVLDGMKHPYFVDKGMWKGVLHLIAVDGASARAYGIRLSCEIYMGVDERIYSAVESDNSSAAYNGGVLIKKATRSALIAAYTKADYDNKVPHQFLFVGNDYCFECLSFNEPIIHEFPTQADAYTWQISPE